MIPIGSQSCRLVAANCETPCGAGHCSHSVDELIRSPKRGLFSSRFWYTRPVDERQTIVTPMTRDGTFFIENGNPVGGVHNLRFNQSIVTALQKVAPANTVVCITGFGYTSCRTGNQNRRILVIIKHVVLRHTAAAFEYAMHSASLHDQCNTNTA